MATGPENQPTPQLPIIINILNLFHKVAEKRYICILLPRTEAQPATEPTKFILIIDNEEDEKEKKRRNFKTQ